MWKNPDIELPQQDEVVCVLTQHWKKHKYMSTEMLCGEVSWSNDLRSCIVDTVDFTGHGSYSVSLKERDEDDPVYVRGIAWCYAKDFPFPEWLPHDPHWGELK